MNQVAIERQSPGGDIKTAKRNSGLFSFLRWFRPSSSRESVNSDTLNSTSGSCESINSVHSSGTVASFYFVPPTSYKIGAPKTIAPGPETDTYKARLKQRDKRREKDKNTTLRKKYNLFFNRDTLLKQNKEGDEDNSRSLPLMTRKNMQDEKVHRRTASESSKIKKAGAYCHVKGKRKAPAPPGANQDTTSLRRKKRLAPPPPAVSAEKILTTLENINKYGTIEYADAVIYNDSLKLDHGILKPAKEETPIASDQNTPTPNTSARSSYVEAPVSPRPWYKRNTRDSNNAAKKEKEPKSEQKYEPIERLPEVQFTRNSTIDLHEESKQKKDDKRKSGLSFLTNISELDREASQIVREQHKNDEMPAFMRPKQEQETNTDTLQPKRRSARDLIAKFNAITNVTKVTVNSAFFGSKETSGVQKRDYFGRQTSKNEEARQKKEAETEKNPNPLMKSESANVIKLKSEPKDTPKAERKSWNCPKCSLENEYWRIICQVCSAIKPYFDDLTSTPKNNSPENTKQISKNTPTKPFEPSPFEKNFERAKTQIGFTALARYKDQTKDKPEKPTEEKPKQTDDNKKEEREKLKKMLIEMKNSLPKRKNNPAKQISRASVIEEKPDETPTTVDTKPEKIAQAIVATTETIYENIKVKKTEHPKPIKVSSSAQTSAVIRKTNIEQSVSGARKKNNYELLKPKDFADIYSDKTGQTSHALYANLAQQDELSLFFNMPKKFSDLKNITNNTDTIEINRLLRRLENAIAKGQLSDAAIYARELAQLKVNCSVVRQKSENESASTQNEFTVDMYVEDKISHRGPFPINVTESKTVAELKIQVEKEFEIPINVQRWILGKELAVDDNATLKDHQVTVTGCPIFLYLVASGNDTKAEPNKKENKPDLVASEENTKNNVPKTPSNVVENGLKSVVGNVQIEKKEIRKKEEPKIVSAIIKTDTKVTKPINVEEVQPNKANVLLASKQPVNDSKESPKNKIIIQPVRKTEFNLEKIAIVPAVELHKETPKETKPEDVVEYDTKTLKPENNDWECKICTLINPPNCNICEVCATIRNIDEPTTSSNKRTKKPAPQPNEIKKKPDQHYLQLVNLDNADLVENIEPFECLVCLTDIEPGQGVTLRECLHQFCKICLANTIEFNDEAEIKCPYRDDQYSCDIALQDREIKALVSPAVYDQFLAKSVAQAENKMDKSFHCKTPDCKGWCIFEDNVNEFRCPVCKKMNCLTCQAIHVGLNCKQYQERMNQQSETDEDAKRTKEMLDEMVSKGEALFCPSCHVILMKKWGCDWVRCSMCKTEICWVTRGPRWGPAGKGDTSGGCKCGVNAVKCHPQCNYCH